MNRPSFITVVSGLPRSGTSLVMQMLAAGGMQVLTDGVRQSDEDNPAGYYEFEPIKRTRQDASWVPLATGKAVKVIYLLLMDLPIDYSYRVIFMRRNLEEVIRSQQTMLERRGERGAAISPSELKRVFHQQVEKVEAWLRNQPSFSTIFLDYGDVVNEPVAYAKKIREFLGQDLDANAMAAVVRAELYRHRHN
jgi:hypothetical protein